jgi:hypothetical protein
MRLTLASHDRQSLQSSALVAAELSDCCFTALLTADCCILRYCLMTYTASVFDSSAAAAELV